MERSFKKEVQALRLGAGETFRGEGILAVAKALLQSGVSYVGGYQGAPISHLLDVLVDAEDIISELGVYFETCTNEASAAAMLGASINYPLRGAVTWKSIVGTNVAADALSNLASPGVIGGALIILGEDYGEGASVIQERSYAYAMKSSIWLLDPRPDLPNIVRSVEKGFELSEATHAPVMLELRIRACHVTGEFAAKDNRPGAHSRLNPIAGPPRFDYARLAHPPVTFAQERLKVEERLPAAQAFIRNHQLNETFDGDVRELGIVTIGGLYNSVIRALERLGLADAFGVTRIPIYVLNCVYPLAPQEVKAFCTGKRAVLVVEEGYPDYVEQTINVELRRADMHTRVFGKGPLPQAGEYTPDVLIEGLSAFLKETRPNGIDVDALAARANNILELKDRAAGTIGALPPRPPTFCTGCPERPVFSAIKIAEREIGPTHISGDIGCHAFATFAPFSLGNSILGYGMSLASAAAVRPNLDRRTIAVMGDGGFWHNGLITGVASSLFNKGDGVLIIMQNGYTSATGLQYMPSSKASRSGPASGMDIERTLRSMGVTWLRKVRTYSVATVVKTLKEAVKSAERGLKVIIADGECQLARQRRLRVAEAGKLARGERVVHARYGVDDEICTGDHSCIRLSGCPSLTVKPNPDPLRADPVATVIESCVGCGLCGEVAHAAVLCPSFYRAEIIRNPHWRDRILHRLRRTVIGWFSSESLAPPDANRSDAGSASRASGEAGADAPLASPPPLAGDGQGGGTPYTPAPMAAPFLSVPCERGTDAQVALPPDPARPITILIAALGGEGGGVLTGWIVAAAEKLGFPVQSTSIPGVAQRTGATTYYIEIFPVRWSELQDRRPVLALTPGIGDIDIVLASELMEAGRVVAGGFVTPDRTLAVASTHRFFVMTEKMAMGDGRFDLRRLTEAIEAHAREHVLFDMDALAKKSGAMINAVMLGALAGCGRLPIAAETLEDAIRAGGKAVESNLAGFRAGLARAGNNAGHHKANGARQPCTPNRSLADIEQEIAATFPCKARDITSEGARRLAGYQDLAYARVYLDRLAAMRVADASAGMNGRLLRETARHLALRMSFEDVIRVAEAKIDPARLRRIAEEIKAGPDQPLVIAEFLKPGIEEMCSVLPSSLARRIMDISARRGWLGRVRIGMEVRTTTIAGYLRFWLLARLKRWRPRSYRFQAEQAWIEAWLGLAGEAAALSGDLALEIVACAQLMKGYGETYKHGAANYAAIETRVIRPVLAGRFGVARGVDAIASARSAALLDPEGEALERCLRDFERQAAYAVAAE